MIQVSDNATLHDVAFLFIYTKTSVKCYPLPLLHTFSYMCITEECQFLQRLCSI